MRSTRMITTCLAAVVALAVAPPWAAADPSPLTDTNFAAGTTGSDTWVVEPGSVRPKPTGPTSIADTFDALGSPWTATPWGTGGTAAASGSLTVDGEHVNDGNPAPTYTSPQTLVFRATFGDALNPIVPFQNVGLGNTYNDPPWAMFSTGGGPLADGITPLPVGFYARTRSAAGETNTPIAVNPGEPHIYRIEWTPTNDVKFYVDGTLVTTPPATVADAMRPVVSDFNSGSNDDTRNVKVDWLAMGSFPTAATFVSRVLQADDARAVWGNVTATGSPGTAAIQTRSGKTATPDGTWSAFQSVGAGGAIQSPSGRYIQYRVIFDSAGESVDGVSIAYTVDADAPDAAIAGVQVSDTTATVSFGSSATDVARFECSVDGGSFAACTSPQQFSGLAAGTHAVAVRAVDRVGNVGNAAGSSFRIESPPAQGGGGPAPAPAPAADKTAPKVTLKLVSARASKSGAVSLRLGCPAGETRCRIGVALKLGRSTVATKTITVSGGETAKLTLRLSKAARRKLAKSGSLNLKAVITATDAAHNTSTATVRLKLRAPSA